MTTKEALKIAIDNLSDEEVEKLYHYLQEMQKEPPKKSKVNVPSYKLKGILDNKHIRGLANELTP